MSDGENMENGWLGMTNNSPYPVYVKEERSSRTHQVPPGGTWDGGVDGLALPQQRRGYVFKTVTGVDVTVQVDGSIRTSARGLRAWAGQRLIGGWGGRAWIDTRVSKGDREWDELFTRSCT